MYPPALAEDLRRRGHDVAAVSERPELRGMDDEPLLDVAATEQRMLVTENVVDFPEIVAARRTEQRSHSGVLLVPARTFPRTERGLGLLARGLDAYLGRHSGDETPFDGVDWLSRTSA